MIYTLFFIADYQFQKVFYVSLGNNFFTVFCGGPLVVEALGNCPVCPLLKSGPVVDSPSFSAALALLIVSRRTRVSGKCLREKCPGGNVRSPVYWCGQQNSSTVDLVYYISTTVERVAAECMQQSL